MNLSALPSDSKPLPRWLVYGAGGGWGHATRALEICNTLEQIGKQCMVYVSPHAKGHAQASHSEPERIFSESDCLERLLKSTHLSGIVVDTFPKGFQGELQRFVSSIRTSLFVARYTSGGYRETEMLQYTHILSPYSEHTDEWEGSAERALYAGLIVKQRRIRLTSALDGRFVVFDTARRITEGLAAALQKASRLAGLQLQLYSHLPAKCSAQKFYVIGAGYNTFYETCGQAVDIRYLPLKRKWDDQHRRADRYGLAIVDPLHLLAWLKQPCAPHGIGEIESQVTEQSVLQRTLMEVLPQ
jgi:hypothetical protein